MTDKPIAAQQAPCVTPVYSPGLERDSPGLERDSPQSLNVSEHRAASNGENEPDAKTAVAATPCPKCGSKAKGVFLRNCGFASNSHEWHFTPADSVNAERSQRIIEKLKHQRDEAIRERDELLLKPVPTSIVITALQQANYELRERAESAERETEAMWKDAEKWLVLTTRPEVWEKLFENAPCFNCGYNGPGYFQPDKHPCAKLYHEAIDEAMK